MPDLTPELLPILKDYRLPDLNLGDEFIYPHYEGGSILNLPSSLCRLLGAPEIGPAPLLPPYTSTLGEGFQRVILVMMDALGFRRFKRWIGDGGLPPWSRLAQEGVFAPLTSITPSTTSAALTSLWTGRSAAEHGLVGYEMWLKEYGLVANSILQSPMSFKGDAGSLRRAGFTPENFLPLLTLGQHLAGHDIKAYAFQHHSIVHSGLSQMFFREVDVRSFNTPADLWVNVRDLVERGSGEKQYVWVYWGEVDYLSHLYGPDDERTVEEFNLFSAAFERIFLNKLKASTGRDTLVVLIADHGQVNTHPDPYYDLGNHPSLTRRLHILPTGENRLAFLHVRPGQREAIQEYVERTWPGQFYFLDSAFAASAGLFGPGEPHADLPNRMGDLILLARGEAYLWWSNKENHLFGRHGGLSPDEMLVPFLAARL
jgi:predicted AlkP superfamily pyrophosphatase or phosphodiesterase